jgi:hypothetical protein
MSATWVAECANIQYQRAGLHEPDPVWLEPERCPAVQIITLDNYRRKPIPA